MHKKIKGSVLAYSLLIIAIMFAIVGSISAVSILQKKNAGSSQSSVQSFQVADNAVQMAIKKIKGITGDSSLIESDKTLAKAFAGCTSSPATVKGNIDSDKSYVITFYKSDNTPVNNCSELLSNVDNIKSIGSYQSTSRVVNVALAATTTNKVRVIKFSSGKNAQCLAEGTPTGCSAEGERGCVIDGTANTTLDVDQNTVFKCVGFGARGANCYLFCLK